MIEIHHEQVDKIPLLHIVKATKRQESLPLVIFIHGFTSAKEHNLHYAYLLAEKGFRVLLPEANLHGERNHGLALNEMTYQFWDIVIQTIAELAQIKDEYIAKGLVDRDRIGLVGTSMGGIVTFGALTQYPWIKVAVSLMGCPAYEQFARLQISQLKNTGVNIPFSDEKLEEMYAHLKKYDLTQQKEAVANRPILFWHGKKDPIVPFQPTYEFYEEIKDQNPAHIRFIVDEQADHKVSREAFLQTIDWFDQHL
ncbi:esterase [Bacillus sp. FJAT-50079]|uniref:esterase n=1 Tax=Bacillus sp. FJAT-50079 TaxID=2833577 RepID=UPI001BC9F9E4|nr:esterase [Bacillus sp. FJAT-50079]MBS4210649.1 esterase [Bacillus sp. FJAT-50079]